MMDPIKVCFVALALLVASSIPAAADRQTDSVVRQLKSQGYSRIVVSRTFLGRVRFVATANGRTREIILNPRTGEILRDYSSNTADDPAKPTLLNPLAPSATQVAKDDQEEDIGVSGSSDSSSDDSGDDGEGDDGDGDDGGEDGGDGEGEGEGESGEGEGESGEGEGEGEGGEGEGGEGEGGEGEGEGEGEGGDD